MSLCCHSPPPPPPGPSTPPHLCLWKVSAEEGPHPLHEPTAPTPQSAPALERSARKLNQRRALDGSRPLKTLHCLPKASPHRGRSICNTVRGAAHYRPSPGPLCLFCAADRGIQLLSRANKRECSYVKKERKERKKRRRTEKLICRSGRCEDTYVTCVGSVAGWASKRHNTELCYLLCHCPSLMASDSNLPFIPRVGEYWLIDTPHHNVCECQSNPLSHKGSTM